MYNIIVWIDRYIHIIVFIIRKFGSDGEHDLLAVCEAMWRMFRRVRRQENSF